MFFANCRLMWVFWACLGGKAMMLGRLGVLNVFSVNDYFSLVWIIEMWLPWWLRWWRTCLKGRRPGFDPWVRKIPWRKKWQPTPLFLLGEARGRGTWWATVHGVTKSWTWLGVKKEPYCRSRKTCICLLFISF